jgi:predicted Fe-Mo cluster-binding NifX family protein
MRIAIPIWEGCVSSVFDFAHQLAIVDTEDQREVSRFSIKLKEQSAQQRVADMVKLGIDVLICGAISRSLSSTLAASNLEVIPFVSGPVDEVLAAYFNNRLSEARFLQGGCRPGARKRFGCIQRHGRQKRSRRGTH